MQHGHINTSSPLQLPWMQGTLDQARQETLSLMNKVNQAYESGDLDRAEVLDGKLERLYEFLESAIWDLEEDGVTVVSGLRTEHQQNLSENQRPGDNVDAESGVVETLAAAYDQFFVDKPPFGMDQAAIVHNLRVTIEEFGGNHADMTDNQIIEAARDAHHCTGRQKALERADKNPAFAASLNKLEALLTPALPNNESDPDEPDTAPGLH